MGAGDGEDARTVADEENADIASHSWPHLACLGHSANFLLHYIST